MISKSTITLNLIVLIAGCLATPFVVWGQDGTGHVVETYALDVTFYPAENSMSGKAIIRFDHQADADEAGLFYLHGELYVDSIKVGKEIIEFEEDKVLYENDYSMVATRVRMESVNVDEPLSVYYGGHFFPSKARSASDYMRIEEAGVFLRSYGYSLWFPTFLSPDGLEDPEVSFTQVVLRTPENYSAVFAGERLSDRVEDGQRISTWKALNLPIFAAQCTARPFEVSESGAYFIYALNDPVSEEMAPRISAFAAELNAFFKSHYRSDALAEQVHIVEMPRYGDISSNNMVGISSRIWRSFEESAYARRTLAHELVHPFVHLKVPENDPLGSMVIEGFPSYFHLYAMAKLFGPAEYEMYMDNVQSRYLEKKATGKTRRGWPLPEEKAITEISVTEIGAYKDLFVLSDRVLLFFDYLKRKIGDEKFQQFTQSLFNRSSIDYETFEELVNTYLGNAEDAKVWLQSNDFPEAFKRK